MFKEKCAMKKVSAISWVQILIITFTLNIATYASQEVWSGAEGRDPGIRRLGTDGSLLGSISLPHSIKSMAIVGNEVWLGADDEPGFYRFALNGTQLSNINGSWSPTSIIVVGNEVWYGSKDFIGILRCAFNGTALPPLTPFPFESSTLCKISENEVWSGAEGRDPGIRRLGTDGSFLGSISLPHSIKSMALVGNEVWLGADDEPGFYRFAPDGTQLSNINGSWSPTSIIVVGNEVWYGSKDFIGVLRCTLDGTALPPLTPFPFESSTLLIAPEPNMGILFTMSVLMLRRKIRK